MVPQGRATCSSWGLVRRDNSPSTHADTNSYAPDNSHTQGIFHDAGPRNASANSTKDKERNDREEYRKRERDVHRPDKIGRERDESGEEIGAEHHYSRNKVAPWLIHTVFIFFGRRL